MKDVLIEPMGMEDYAEFHALWAHTPGIGLSAADSQERIAAYLQRNPTGSFLARHAGRVVATILGGHDGRRGFLHHLAVAEEMRGAGIARALVQHCLDALRREGIDKCHLMVLADNAEGLAFWRHLGFHLREDVSLVSMSI